MIDLVPEKGVTLGWPRTSAYCWLMVQIVFGALAIYSVAAVISESQHELRPRSGGE